jgi:malonate transporter
MVLNSLFPVFALIFFGSLLKRFRLTNDVFLRTSDKLTYYIFFPLLLFWKIGGASTVLSSNTGLYKAVICAVLTVYVLSTAFIVLFKVPEYQAGSFSQSCYRFNSYIGVAIVLTALGEEGIKHFGILIGMIIPIINVLCVSTLTWFSEKKMLPAKRIGQTVKGLITNPLILACISGILYANLLEGFPPFIDSTLRLCSFVALPMAMLSIGGALSLDGIKGHFKLSLIASMFKLLVLPAVGFLFLSAFGVSDLAFKVGLIYFALPTSPALYILSSQLNSDTQLASAAIALSTLLSFLSLSAALTLNGNY